jgi:hypothetical protein
MGKDKALYRKQKEEAKERQKKYEEEQAAIQRKADKEKEEREKYGWWSYDGYGRGKFISFEEAKINAYEVPKYVMKSFMDWCQSTS